MNEYNDLPLPDFNPAYELQPFVSSEVPEVVLPNDYYQSYGFVAR